MNVLNNCVKTIVFSPTIAKHFDAGNI